MEDGLPYSKTKHVFLTWNALIGVLLVVTGIVFLVNPENLSVKVGASLVLVGAFCLILVNIDEKGFSKIVTSRQFTFILVLWVVFMLLLTYNVDAEVFLIVVILGVLILIELLSFFMTPPMRRRATILFYLLIVAFLAVVEQSIVHRLLLR